MRELRWSMPTFAAAVALIAMSATPEVARAFTPTQDDRYIHVTNAQPTETATPVPFQPFSDGRFVLIAGLSVADANQFSSFLAAGVEGQGAAHAESLAFGISTESVLDVRFDLAEGAAFSLELTLSRLAFASSSFVLERTAPSPAVLVTANTNALLDQTVGMPPGSYRLRAAAISSQPGSTSGSAFYRVDFQRTCSSATQDSDGDQFVDGCDICPLNFDPSQADTDGDGYGDACDVPEIISLILDPAQNAVQNPTRAALASDGSAYVVSVTNSRLYRISPPAGPAIELFDGAPLSANVQDIAVAADGFVYTAGGTPAKCYRIHPGTGAATQVLGPAGDGVNALTFADRVATAPDGRVFVSGRDSQNVFEIAVGGAVAQVIGPSGDGSTPLGQPRALDVDAYGVVHVVQSLAPTVGFRIPPTGPIGPLIDSTGDGQGHTLQSAQDVVVADGPTKRIVVVGTQSNNAFLIEDSSSAAVPLLGPAAWSALALALLGAASLSRRR